MALVTYVEHDGARHDIEVPDGDTVMRGAVSNGIDAIVGECGGGLACATCHCIVDEAWADRVGPPSQPEEEMLEFAATGKQASSRLSCQIVVSSELDGLVVHLPEAQY